DLGSVTLPSDVLKLMEECERGAFYKSLMREGETLGSVKKRVLTAFYSRNRKVAERRWANKMKARIRRIYPSLAAMLSDLKTKDYRRAAHLMQHFEAAIVIHRVCGRLMREHRDIPLLTLHDGLFTTAQHISTVERVMRAEFAKIGVSPTLKRE